MATVSPGSIFRQMASSTFSRGRIAEADVVEFQAAARLLQRLGCRFLHDKARGLEQVAHPRGPRSRLLEAAGRLGDAPDRTVKRAERAEKSDQGPGRQFAVAN